MNLASYIRYMQSYAHIAHNILGGQTFFSDHAFLGELYGTYEDAYDMVVERMIGLEEPINLVKINQDAVKDLEEPSSYNEAFKELLKCEEDLCKKIETIAPKVSQGTMQMLGNIADASEVRQYKLKQRLK